MERKKLYSEIPDDLLGAFYIYVQNNIKKGINIDLMNNEITLIENESNLRNISMIELKEIGLDFIDKERVLVKQFIYEGSLH